VEIFAYGSLIHPEVWQAVTGKAHRSEPGTIRGFIRRTICGATFPGIIATENGSATVSGAIYHGVDSESLAALDAFESDFYVRSTLEARDGNGGIINCDAYLVPAENAHLLSDSEWDPDDFVANHLRAFLARNFG
jgi:gamma-glutamylcyclotransferase (GGCT)/AIG2-like uncharacterized protein YtfP